MRRSVWVLLAALLLVSPSARANGRFPATTTNVWKPGDPQTGLLATTFGMLLTSDGGASWRWLCEDVLGNVGTADPAFAITATGAILAGTPQHLVVSRDGGCSWTEVGGPVAGAWITDVQVAGDGAVWVATANGTAANDAYLSTDDGKTFAPAHVPETMAFWKTLRVAPSDPKRVYVSGYRIAANGSGAEIILYRTDNAGQSWTKLGGSFGTVTEVPLFGVSPANPDVVLVHVIGPAETLYRSTNAGQSFDPVFQPTVQLTTFAFEADGQHAVTASTFVHGGVWTSDDGGAHFAPATQQPLLACVDQRSDGTLYGCASNWVPDFMALGVSTDHGQSFSKTFRFNEMAGALQCPDGTPGKTCESQFTAPNGIADQFEVGKPDAGTAEAPDAAMQPPAKKSGCGGCNVSAAMFLLVGFRGWGARRARR